MVHSPFLQAPVVLSSNEIDSVIRDILGLKKTKMFLDLNIFIVNLFALKPLTSPSELENFDCFNRFFNFIPYSIRAQFSDENEEFD
jgi:hypothetical protein